MQSDGGKRLVVRPRYRSEREGGGFGGSSVYQVVDGMTVIGTHEEREDAARQVLVLGACIALTWERTVIGGRTGSHDFTARFGALDAGRIHREKSVGGGGFSWRWSMYAHLDKRIGNANGRCEDRIEAAKRVERSFTELLAASD